MLKKLKRNTKKLIAFFIKQSISNNISVFFDFLVDEQEKRKRSFFSFHKRPVYEKQLGIIPCFSNDNGYSAFAIVIQGPVQYEYNFTFETIEIYKKNFPGAKIILSTWKDEEYRIKNINTEGIILIFSDPPQNPGYWNINKQIQSTSAGINVAKQCGCEYVLKTRTDQRIYSPELLCYLKSLLEIFPLSLQASMKQLKRIIILNPCKYRPFAVSDMFMFGDIQDLLTYWTVAFDERASPSPVFTTILDEVLFEPTEIYVSRSYFKNKISLEISLNNWWNILADYFIAIDMQDIDFFWPKYDSYNEYRMLCYENDKTSDLLYFREWVAFQSGLRPIYGDSVLNYRFGEDFIS